MTAHAQQAAPPPPPPIYAAPGRKVEVNLTDTIHWSWYLAGVVIPLIGFIAGIVFMAKSKIGPAIALWATCFLAALTWGGLYAAIEYDRLTGNDRSILEDYNSTGDSTSPAEDETDTTSSGFSDCLRDAETHDEINAC